MRKTILYTIVFAAVLILGSFTTVAIPDNAPGLRRNTYDNQREFVLSILSDILDRLQSRGVNPPGLLKILFGLFLGAELDDEPDEEDEEPEEDNELEDEEEPEDEDDDEENEEPEEDDEEEPQDNENEQYDED